MDYGFYAAALAAALAALVLIFFFVDRKRAARQAESRFDLLLELMQEELKDLRAENDRLASQNRQETLAALGEMSRTTLASMGRVGDAQSGRLMQITQEVGRLAEGLRGEFEALRRSQSSGIETLRTEVEQKLTHQVHQSFRQVDEQLVQVNQGLGEMRQLAREVTDLKGALTNVKTRGLWGERQLENLLASFLSSGQYASQVQVRANSAERVDFAVFLPSEDPEGPKVFLPIDAKFPLDAYNRVRAAADAGDGVALSKARALLAQALLAQGRSVAEKYIAPPETTDFAVLFLPNEGLYGEALGQDDLVEKLQRDHRVLLAGPTTLAALLSALRVGFRALALARRGGEIWDALTAIRQEFGKFGDALEKARKQVAGLSDSLEATQRRVRVMERRLSVAEGLKDEQE